MEKIDIDELQNKYTKMLKTEKRSNKFQKIGKLLDNHYKNKYEKYINRIEKDNRKIMNSFKNPVTWIDKNLIYDTLIELYCYDSTNHRRLIHYVLLPKISEGYKNINDVLDISYIYSCDFYSFYRFCLTYYDTIKVITTKKVKSLTEVFETIEKNEKFYQSKLFEINDYEQDYLCDLYYRMFDIGIICTIGNLYGERENILINRNLKALRK